MRRPVAKKISNADMKAVDQLEGEITAEVVRQFQASNQTGGLPEGAQAGLADLAPKIAPIVKAGIDIALVSYGGPIGAAVAANREKITAFVSKFALEFVGNILRGASTS